MKYVLVTGGVVSGLGKGVTASSIGVLLKACGLRVTSIKIDPYLNTDAGTMSPFEHGEVFVLDDGGEVDLDLGNYERFLDIKLTRDHNITTGKVYQSVIDKERRGDYLGKTVQVVPHIIDAIQEWIERVAKIPVDGHEGPPDVCVIELGGTIGDIESMPFIEALGQFSYRVGPGNFCLIHVSLVPVLNVVGEQKTKPTQHSVRGLRGLGLTPDMLACRSTLPLDENVKAKLSQFCHVPNDCIITLHDVPNIWHIPLLLRDQKAHEAILKVLNLNSVSKEPVLDEWTERAERCDMLRDTVKIAMVGKYTGLTDSYLSVLKALLHASVACSRRLTVDWVPASDLEEATEEENPQGYTRAWNLLKGADGILVPGGFGDRGVEGKILAAQYARENKIPYLGICLGMQIAVVEFARSVLGVEDASSTEFEKDTKSPYVIFMPEGSTTHMGGTMRLGSRRTYFQVNDAKSAKLYGNASFVDERHRHRYEVNPDMVDQLESAGMSFTGKDETGQRMEIIELPDHPFFIGAQFHPEFKSRPGKPSPLFVGLIAAATGQLDVFLENAACVHNPLQTEMPRCTLPAIFPHDMNTKKLANGVHIEPLKTKSPHCMDTSEPVDSYVKGSRIEHQSNVVTKGVGVSQANGTCEKHLNGFLNGVHTEYPVAVRSAKGISSVIVNGSVNGIHPNHDNGYANGDHRELGNGFSSDVYLGYADGSLNDTHKNDASGTLNGVNGDHINGIYSNVNGFHR